MLENVKQDYCRINYCRSQKPEQVSIVRLLFEAVRNSGFRAVVFYRTGRWCRVRRLGLMAALFERLMRHWSHCWISTLADIGPGFVIAHVCGIIIPPGVRIGANCTVRQNVTLGGNYGKKDEEGRTNPWLEDEVSIGPGAAILGPIKIGRNTIIGANAVVTTHIPENSVVGGMRAEVVALRNEDGSIRHYDEKIFFSRRELYERLRNLEKRLEELESRVRK
ncbi:MAG TPA: serine acetyltransferase [Anaerohalosphaeraceae bacterium]|nr:serine acetyltransferase [Anaerohalosphaeraceae bacterium]